MKKILFIFLVNVLVSQSFAQDWEAWDAKRKDSLRKINNKQLLSDIFFNGDSDGLLYMGVTNSWEMSSYFLGGEVKLYDSYYTPKLSGSVYANYRQAMAGDKQVADFNAVSVGGHFLFFGLETSCYFNKNYKLYYLTPKLGFDYGSWSVFYGYGFPLNQSDFKGTYGHNLSLKYHLYLSAFAYHKSRKKSYGY